MRNAQKSRSKFLPWVFMGAVLLVYGIHCHFLQGVIDDAFINFRFARNLSAGHGFVFNPGGERVEGFTNLLWVLILSFLYDAGVSFITSSTILGIISGAGSLVVIFAIARDRFGSYSLWTLLPPLALALNSCFAGWSVRLMGTPLFTFLALAGVYLHIKRRWLFSGILFGLAVLSRQEVVLIILPLWAAHVLVGFRNGQLKEAGKDLARAAIPFGVILGGLLIWRLSYFGYLFPNTFYAKVSGGPVEYSHGLEFAWEFFYKYLIYWVIPGLFLWQWKSVDEGGIRKAFAVIVPLYFFYIIYTGGDFPGHPFYRYFHPVLPFAILLFVELLFLAYYSHGKRGKIVLSAIVVSALVLTLIPSREQIDDYNFSAVVKWGRFLGNWIRHNTPAKATLAVGAAGAIPFYAHRFTYDLHGLTDTHIAHKKMIMTDETYSSLGKYDAGYILDQAPDIIILSPSTSRSPREYDFNDPNLTGVIYIYKEMFNHPQFKENYTLKLITVNNFFLHLYYRKQNSRRRSVFPSK